MVFQECSSAVRGLRSSFSNSLVLNKQEEDSTRMGKVGRKTVWFGGKDKRREGVTRLIKLFYQLKLQNLQVQNFILNKIFSKQIKLYT